MQLWPFHLPHYGIKPAIRTPSQVALTSATMAVPSATPYNNHKQFKVANICQSGYSNCHIGIATANIIILVAYIYHTHNNVSTISLWLQYLLLYLHPHKITGHNKTNIPKVIIFTKSTIFLRCEKPFYWHGKRLSSVNLTFIQVPSNFS